MNIQQLKQDRERGISHGRVTIDKLIEAALIMEAELISMCDHENDDAIMAVHVLKRVKEL